MRNYFFFLPLVLCSCGQLGTENAVTDHLILDIDTVMVDAGDEILYMEDGASTLSSDGKFFYNFNRYDHTLEKIDLAKLRLVEKLPFEKEGPNGTGNFVYSIHMLDENGIFMGASWTAGLFQPDGTRTAHYDLSNDGFQGDVLTAYERFDKTIMVPSQPGVIFVLVSNWKDKTFNLRKMDFKQKLITQYDIDPENKIPRYTFKVPSMSKDPITSPGVYLSVEQGKLIISSSLTNQIHLYDPLKDSLISKSNQHRLTANEKTGQFPEVYASLDDLMAAYQKVGEEVNFLPPMWDKDNERFYRFSHLMEFEREKTADAVLPEVSRFNLFLSVYDKHFNLLAEAPFPLSIKRVPRSFVSDGKIWIEENMDEELGFIRLKVDLKDG